MSDLLVGRADDHATVFAGEAITMPFFFFYSPFPEAPSALPCSSTAISPLPPPDVVLRAYFRRLVYSGTAVEWKRLAV